MNDSRIICKNGHTLGELSGHYMIIRKRGRVISIDLLQNASIKDVGIDIKCEHCGDIVHLNFGEFF